MLGCGDEEPAAVIPDPVAFRPLFEEGKLELEVFFYEEEDFSLGDCEVGLFCCRGICCFRLGFAVLRCGELFGEDIFEDYAAVVPYRVVLGILVEESGSEEEAVVGEVVGGDLSLSAFRD